MAGTIFKLTFTQMNDKWLTIVGKNKLMFVKKDVTK
jgi:hypothetical protein